MSDLTGMRFGRLVVVEQGKTRCYWICRCDCGTIREIYVSNLRRGATQSCGCLHREIISRKFTTHGHARSHAVTSTFACWASMLSRCQCATNKRYKIWGGRGIKVDDRWNDFSNFLSDMGERPSKDYSIDRIDNNGNYCKENCRWATMKEQNRNRRDNRWITIAGKKKILQDWIKECGVSDQAIRYRAKKLGSFEQAVAYFIEKRVVG